jgi:hypothetical protein
MPLISQTVGQDYADMYSGYNQQKVGAGLITPDIYSTPQYSKKKIKNLVMGGISDIMYVSHDIDPNPLVLPFVMETQYSTVLAFNLNYVPPNIRKNILKFVLDSNAARIRANQPIIINYDSVKRAVPQVQGIVRRYKIVLTRPTKTYQLNEWPEVAKKRSSYQNIYKEGYSR